MCSSVKHKYKLFVDLLNGTPGGWLAMVFNNCKTFEELIFIQKLGSCYSTIFLCENTKGRIIFLTLFESDILTKWSSIGCSIIWSVFATLISFIWLISYVTLNKKNGLFQKT